MVVDRTKMGSVDSHPILMFAPVHSHLPFHMPTRSYSGDAGFDLTCSERVVIPPKEFANIPTNVCASLPWGTWAMVCGRSSSFHKHRLVTNQGIIDSGFQGELMASVFNAGTEQVVVEKGDRIVQLILFELVNVRVAETDKEDFRETTRGMKGFGSTGR